MFMIAILPEAVGKFFQFCRGNFPFMLGKFHDLMPGKFNGSGFMTVHMSRLGGHDSFIRRQRRINDNLICLRPANQKENFRIRAGAGLPDFFRCACTVWVAAVTGILFQVNVRDPF